MSLLAQVEAELIRQTLLKVHLQPGGSRRTARNHVIRVRRRVRRQIFTAEVPGQPANGRRSRLANAAHGWLNAERSIPSDLIGALCPQLLEDGVLHFGAVLCWGVIDHVITSLAHESHFLRF